jgi:hypothetical protein
VEYKSLDVVIQAGGQTFRNERLLWLLNARPRKGEKKSPGVPGDWAGVVPGRIATTNESAATRRMIQAATGVITGEEALTQRMAPIIRGSDDISARLFAQWDDRCLYLAADVVDDKVEAGDQVEFLLARPSAGPAHGEEVLRLVCAPDAKAARLTRPGAAEATDAPMSAVRNEKGYRVEATIPRDVLGIPPEAGVVLHMDAVLTDCDGGTRHAQLVWAAPPRGLPLPQGFLVLGK